jgi:hypothetical protein
MVRDGFQLPSGVLGGLAALGISPVFTPQGRLTTTTVTPVLSGTVAAAGTVFYTPYLGNLVPVQFSDGGGWSYAASAEVSNVLANSATGNAGPAACVANSNYDLFGWMNAGVFTLTRGPYWQTAAATVTISIANPAVVAWNAHGLQIGDPVTFTTTGALPHGGTNDVVAGTTYFVIATGFTANAFSISLTVGGAAINTTGGSQSGVHTAIGGSELLRGTGAGTTELKRVNGILVNANAITNGPGAGLGTYLGSVRTNATATVDWIYGGLGTAAVFGIFNAYNRVTVASQNCYDNVASWNYTSASIRAFNGASITRCSFIQGVTGDAFQANLSARVVYPATLLTGYVIGIGFDTTTAYTSFGAYATNAAAQADGVYSTVNLATISPIGWHFLQANENGDGANQVTITGGGNSGLSALLRL